MLSSLKLRVGVILSVTSFMGLAGCGGGSTLDTDGGLDGSDDGEASDFDTKQEDAKKPETGSSCGEKGSTQDCGHCGTQTCESTGMWGTCTGEGVCAPGDMAPDGCYMGAEATCNSSCDWVCP